MSMEADLFTMLKAICPRTYPDFAPTSTVRPYVTFQKIGGKAINYTDGVIPTERNVDVQINVWSDTRLQADALIAQIEDAMRAATAFTARPNAAPMTDFDADMQVYACIQDYSIWASK